MNSPLLSIRDLKVHFPQPRGLSDLLTRRPAAAVRAVDGVSLDIHSGETLGLVGESGCGKSTLGRSLVGLSPVSGGEISFADGGMEPLSRLGQARHAQMVFQDPFSSLNPKMTIGEILSEVLLVHDICARADVGRKVSELLELVGLPKELAPRRPRTLSGGQCQRIGIARALAIDPALLIADESVSALDVSVQAQILNLLMELKDKRQLTILFISHDLSVVRHICQRVAVMYLGKIVEYGAAEEIFANPRHPYTRALLRSRPRMDGSDLHDIPLLEGEPPSPIDRPKGCPFQPRCGQARAQCGTAPPMTRQGRVTLACWLFREEANDDQAKGDNPSAREISSAVRVTSGASSSRAASGE